MNEENRNHIINFIAKRLKIGGTVYISYNCYPGWATMAPLRQLMVMLSGNSSDPLLPRIDQALAKIQTLFDTNSMYSRVNPMLKDRFEGVRKQSRPYIAHEYFNRDWTIFYHTDVARDMRSAKLDYATTIEVLEHLDNFNLTAEQLALLQGTENTDHREVMRDFITNRQFRRDLYIKGRLPLDASERMARLMATRFVLTTPDDGIQRNVLTPLGKLALTSDVFDPLIAALARGPRTLAQLVEDDALRALAHTAIVEAITVLIGQNHVQPCLPPAGDAERAKSTAAFNTAVMERALRGSDLQFVASPLTGGGYQIGRFEQLFLLAEQRQLDPAAFVAECLAARGDVLVRTGQTEGSVDLARLAGLTPSGVICEIIKDDGTMARLPDLKAFGEKHGIRIVAVADLIRWRMRNEVFVEKVVDTQANVRGIGEFNVRTYRTRTTGGLHMAIFKGDLAPEEAVLARVQAYCPTGDILRTRRCDCDSQLDTALARIEQEGRGVLLYMHVAGGGQAPAVLARTRAHLGLTDARSGDAGGGELREMGMGAQILADIGARRLRLMTNNPRKIIGLEGYGIEVVERVPLETAEHADTASFLAERRIQLGHLLPEG